MEERQRYIKNEISIIFKMSQMKYEYKKEQVREE